MSARCREVSSRSRSERALFRLSSGQGFAEASSRRAVVFPDRGGPTTKTRAVVQIPSYGGLALNASRKLTQRSILLSGHRSSLRRTTWSLLAGTHYWLSGGACAGCPTTVLRSSPSASTSGRPQRSRPSAMDNEACPEASLWVHRRTQMQHCLAGSCQGTPRFAQVGDTQIHTPDRGRWYRRAFCSPRGEAWHGAAERFNRAISSVKRCETATRPMSAGATTLGPFAGSRRREYASRKMWPRWVPAI